MFKVMGILVPNSGKAISEIAMGQEVSMNQRVLRVFGFAAFALIAWLSPHAWAGSVYLSCAAPGAATVKYYITVDYDTKRVKMTNTGQTGVAKITDSEIEWTATYYSVTGHHFLLSRMSGQLDESWNDFNNYPFRHDVVYFCKKISDEKPRF
jgi:hypothetical protein